MSDWRPDPTGRFEERLYVAGQPTDIVRRDGVDSRDADGAMPGEETLAEPATPSVEEESLSLTSSVHDVPQRRSRRRWPWVVAGSLLVIVVGSLVTVMATGGGDSEGDYLEALDEAGLRDDFTADRAAVSHAEELCADLDGGAPAQGSEADEIAVAHYCEDYLEAFEILEQQTVEGTFTIIDGDSANAVGDPCEGEGGYGDLNASTAVVVKNSDGDEVARTSLGTGRSTSIVECEFSFELELSEGEETYLLTVGDRGEIAYSWDEISAPSAIALTIG